MARTETVAVKKVKIVNQTIENTSDQSVLVVADFDHVTVGPGAVTKKLTGEIFALKVKDLFYKPSKESEMKDAPVKISELKLGESVKMSDSIDVVLFLKAGPKL